MPKGIFENIFGSGSSNDLDSAGQSAESALLEALAEYACDCSEDSGVAQGLTGFEMDKILRISSGIDSGT